MGYKSNLRYHIVLVTKYRKKLLIKYGNIIKSIILDISNKNKFSIITQEVDKDHIHILVKANPNLSPKSIVSIIKQVTTYKLYQLFKSELRDHFYYNNVFWSKGYFVSSVGDTNEEVIKRYIENQG
jgi:putative transposase